MQLNDNTQETFKKKIMPKSHINESKSSYTQKN